jgi:hypothetical protein
VLVPTHTSFFSSPCCATTFCDPLIDTRPACYRQSVTMSGGTVELWTLYGIAVCITFLRTYARIAAVGIREFHPDDYLIWLAIVSIVPLPLNTGCGLTVTLHRLSTLLNVVSAILWELPPMAWRTTDYRMRSGVRSHPTTQNTHGELSAQRFKSQGGQQQFVFYGLSRSA